MGREHSGDLSIDMRIILKWRGYTKETLPVGGDWIHLAIDLNLSGRSGSCRRSRKCVVRI
jgi:hypothetical protein